MAYSKIALFLLFNVIFFTLVSSHSVPCPPPPSKKPSPSSPHHKPTCKDALKLKVCANVLDLVKISLSQKSKCCSLIENLVDLEAAVCLCTALKANVLGLKLNVPVSLKLVLNQCGKKVPSGFKCHA